jgi:hypothetical protein
MALTGHPKIVKAVLRVYKKEVSGVFIPLPAPSNGSTLEPVIVESVPCYYAQILSTQLTESLDSGISASTTFPYVRESTGSGDANTAELTALKPATISGESVPVFLPQPFRPSYLYKLDYLTEGIDNELNTYYNSSKETSDREALYTAIDNKSAYSYWLYMSDYDIKQNVKQSSISLSFTDASYKLASNWSYVYPEDTFFEWAYDQSTKDSNPVPLLGDKLIAEYEKNETTNVFDGWTIPGVLLALMYYSGLFPMVATDEATSLDLLNVTKSVDGSYTTYTLTWDGGASSSDVLVLSSGGTEPSEGNLTAINIPISAFVYPDEYSLLSDGYYFSANPYDFMTDILNELSDLIGFFWRMNRAGELEVTSNYYKKPSGTLTFTDENIQSVNYQYDDSNLRNHIFVFGRPFSSDHKVEATAENSTSLEYFGRKSFVFEHSLIMYGDQAQSIADNLLDTYSFTTGQIQVSQYFNTTDDIVYPGQDIVFDVSDEFTTVGMSSPLIVSDFTIRTEPFSKASIEYSIKQPIERTTIDLPTGIENLSYMGDSFHPEEVSFVFDTESAEIQGATNLAAGASFNLGNETITSDTKWLQYKDYPDEDSWYYNVNWSQDLNVIYIDTINVTLSYNTDSGTHTVTHQLNVESLHKRATIALSGGGGVETADSCYLSLIFDNHTEKSWSGLPLPESNATTISITLECLGGDVLSEFEARLTSKTLDSDNKFALKFSINNTYDQEGIFEGGFLVIALPPLGRDDSGMPFNNIDISEGNLTYNTKLFPAFSWKNVLTELIASEDVPPTIVDGNLETKGSLAYIGGIDLEETYNISNTITSNYYIVESESTTEELSPIIFNPFIEVDDEVLAFANVMVIIPYIIFTDNDGRTYMDIKNQYFLLHNKFDKTVNPIELVGVKNGITPYTQATSDSRTHFGYLRGSNDEYKDYYNIAKTKTYSQNHYLNLNTTTIDSEIKFYYKNAFPVSLWLALTQGKRNWVNVLKYPDIHNVILLNYKNVSPTGDYKLTSDFSIFNTELTSLREKIKEQFNKNDSTYPLILFINPFYRWGLHDYEQYYVGETPPFTDDDCMGLAIFAVGSVTDNSVRSNSLATIKYTDNAWYPTSVDKEAPDLGAFEYKGKNLE